ncbi:MAG: glycosyltransferase family 9 protein [Candidatus Omnitrophota bacterium]
MGSHLFGKNILCIRLDNMGDVLMCSPAIHAIKDSIAGCSVTMLVSSTGKAIASLIDSIDRLITYDAPWMKQTQAKPDPNVTLSTVKLLKNLNFDSAIIFTTYSQSALPAALLCYLAGIRVRVGYCRENPYYLLTHWQAEEEPHQFIRHEVKRQIDLVDYYGCRTIEPRLRLSIKTPAACKISLITKNFQSKWYVLHAGASAPSRCYPVHSYAKVVNLMRHKGWQTILTGSENERDYVEQINNSSGNTCINLSGGLSVEELCALIARSPFLLSNNTCPVHIASAVGTPVVVLYALTNPQHCPWNVPSRVLFMETDCGFCYKSICPKGHHQCLDSISPENIVTAIHDLLKESPPVLHITNLFQQNP